MAKIFILEDNIERMKKFNREFIGHIIFHADNIEDGKKILLNEKVDYIFLDHDLDDRIYVNSNEVNTGYQMAKWIVDNCITYSRLIVHSLNRDGALNIKSITIDAEIIPFTMLFKK
jgi:hypothetical protein